MRLRRSLVALVSLAAVIATCLAGVSPATAGPYDPIWLEPARGNRAAILKVLDEPTEFAFKQASLEAVLKFVRTRHKINLYVDHKSLEEAGFSLKEPITSELKGVTLRDALELTLKPCELTWIIRRGVLTITTVSHEEGLSESVIYPVEDLLLPPVELRYPGRTYRPDYDSLVEALVGSISPTAWSELGGAPPVRPYHGSLVIRISRQGHEEIADIFRGLRAVRQSQFPSCAKQPPAAVRTVSRPRGERVDAALRQPIELALANVDLTELAWQISRQCEIPVALDQKALAEAGIEPAKTRFNQRLGKVPLESALDLLLEEHGLSWFVRGGMLHISSQSASEGVMQVRVYPIRGLGDRPLVSPMRQLTEEYETLLELVSSSVAPTTWAEVGGSGSLAVVPRAGALVVSQTAQIHEELEQFLAGLRKARAVQPTEGIDEADKEPAADELVVFAYRIPGFYLREIQASPARTDKPAAVAAPAGAERAKASAAASAQATREYIAQQYAAALPKFVDPESWGSGRGTIEAVGDMLFVRQRMAVHEQVAKYLTPGWCGMGGIGGMSGLR